MSAQQRCASCTGTGEIATDYGPADCPDCGGGGALPTRAVLTDWRMRDLERAIERERPLGRQDVSWLLDELREARKALHEVIALAHDIRDDDQIALRIRMTASRAMGLYQVVEPARPGTAAESH